MSAKYFRIKVDGELKNGVYIGDPCYILPDETYRDVWEEMYDFEDGEIRTKDGKLLMIVSGTAYGDGCYPAEVEIQKGSNKNMQKFDIPVDAGAIAIVNMEFADPNWKQDSFLLNNENCYIVENPVSEIRFKSDEDGSFEFKFKTKDSEYVINTFTGDDYEDDEEEDYEEEDEDDDEYR